MPLHSFSTERAKAMLAAAVATVEGESAAEIVVAVRKRAGNWLAVDLGVGAVIGWVALLFCLFSPPEFSLVGIAAIVLAFMLAGTALSRASGSARLVLVPRSRIDQAVLTVARATFVELGVANTRARTGVLVLVVLEECRIEIVADVGVLAAVDRAQWTEQVGRIVRVPDESGMGAAGVEALARSIEGLASLLHEALPRASDDTNELEDLA